jgi:D-inositol-3-phosphate glycosyltransferase
VLSLHSCPLGRPGTRDTGGMSIYVKQVSLHLGQKGIAVDVFTSHQEPEGPEPMELGENVRLIHLPSEAPQPGGKLGLYPHLSDLACAAHTFGREAGLQYDLVHSHYWLSGLAGQVLAGWWKVPHITMLHTSARAKNRALGSEVETELRSESEREILSTADLIVAATRKEERDLVELYDATPAKIAVIPCGVDMEMFQPHPKNWARSTLGLNASRIILYVGRLEPEKGLDLLLDAVALMKDRGGLTVLILGGGDQDGEEKERLGKRCHELGISENVRPHDAVEHRQMPIYYSAADICVLPSCYETFGLATLEAMACGIPVIAGRVGVMAELAGDDGTIVLEERSPENLAAILSNALRDTVFLENMAARTRHSVMEMSWKSVSDRLVLEYERTMEGRQRLSTAS